MTTQPITPTGRGPYNTRKIGDPVACCRCGRVLPFDPQHFKARSDTRCGCVQPCRDCARKALSKPGKWRPGDMRACCRCHVEKPWTVEYFIIDKRRPYGLRTLCRECGRAESRERQAGCHVSQAARPEARYRPRRPVEPFAAVVAPVAKRYDRRVLDGWERLEARILAGEEIFREAA